MDRNCTSNTKRTVKFLLNWLSGYVLVFQSTWRTTTVDLTPLLELAWWVTDKPWINSQRSLNLHVAWSTEDDVLILDIINADQLFFFSYFSNSFQKPSTPYWLTIQPIGGHYRCMHINTFQNSSTPYWLNFLHIFTNFIYSLNNTILVWWRINTLY